MTFRTTELQSYTLYKLPEIMNHASSTAERFKNLKASLEVPYVVLDAGKLQWISEASAKEIINRCLKVEHLRSLILNHPRQQVATVLEAAAQNLGFTKLQVENPRQH